MFGSKKAEFVHLFQEFADAFPFTSDGQKHISLYDENRQTGRHNFQEIQAAVARGEDITDLVLLKLLPHAGTVSNEARGAWVHHAPSISGNLKKWYESDGKSYDWTAIAQAIFNFVQRCVTDPTELKDACLEFSSLTCSKGFQVGMLTPILNALRPDEFLLVNKKPWRVINYFEDTSYNALLTGYPQINTELQRMIQAVAPEMRQICPNVALHNNDLFDMFCHWLVAVKKYTFDVRYWKIAPGETAWQWEECRDQGFIAIEWDELGDISTLDHKEFDERRDQLIAQHPELKWKKSGVNQVYVFAQIKPGDYIVANKGKTKVLGIGTVTGTYYFEPNAPRQKHRLPVHWHDLTPKDVDQKDWQRTLVALNPEIFEAIVGDTMLPQTVPSQVNSQCPFTAKTFELLAELNASPRKTTYLARRDDFKQQLEEPFQKLLRQVATQLPAAITEQMETERKLFARIPKNDFNHGGAWDFYWGAFYLKGGKRIEDAQLFLWMNHERLEFGFYIGAYGGAQRQQFLTNCQTHYDALLTLLEPSLADDDIWYGIRGSQTKLDWKDWLKNPQGLDIHVDMRLSRQDVLSRSTEQLIDQITQTYKRFFPLILLAITEEPLPLLLDYLEPLDDDDIEAKVLNTPYSLAACAASTYLDESLLGDWVEAIERKGQAVLYGPPGTGKTFLARCFAKHLISEGDGFVELVQFHPAYTYEDFIEGIRPQMGKSGLEYPHVPGRLLEFCEKAEQRHDRCVLIIDEINRANLAQVFGELMYLLEYRDEEINLASGRKFRIPTNVRIISTMNTADRSIALVDHALRRRFAFLYVPPNYEGLRKYHQLTGYATENLVNLLQHINAQIGDSHYQLGTSFFLRENLDAELKSIWQLEIEPYLEEFFFDQSDKMKNLRWAQVEGQLRP
ncbi:AAA family ATPase [Phormidium sp. FACHB-592]|uniref:AAA family ATPase n=1 Tax=Stenomitos frigidus AS-A4 TaxID=2933935 RepID=A0ABV0KP99_9CYAN|nr:AAA family ATPase [Phormidium sp. FACHB-592]MBD2075479.1 AAA family ATPase [Phormidium sp. FACHB-592]